jgi:hypothetical protein
VVQVVVLIQEALIPVSLLLLGVRVIHLLQHHRKETMVAQVLQPLTGNLMAAAVAEVEQ